MTKDAPAVAGIGGAMPRAEYDTLEAVNWSRLKQMQRSALAFKHAMESEHDDSDPMRLGRAVHVATLEPDLFDAQFVVWSGERRQGKKWETFEVEHASKTILTVDQLDRTIAIRDAVRSHPLVAPYLVSGKAEHTLTWMDTKSGLPMKCRIDWVTRGVILDLKTSRHAVDTHMFQNDAYRLGYFHQLAYYRRGMHAVYGETPAALIVAVETVAPHDVAVYRLSDDALYAAEEEIDDLTTQLVRARRTDTWPGRFAVEQALDLPRWAQIDGEDY